ncbi:peritrophin-1 [Cephus cinctus]|uniref:Peritrophin-1 n=1 Tax=Cephus cinctus TaxID=211228 RepID=A0AAJ7BUR9_CEPCN|nr:peritrophin-1 [Cephus cinctus]
MKAVAAFFFLGLVVIAFSVDDEIPEGVNCPAQDPENATHVPHPTNCNLFYTCSGGWPILSSCPAGLHFNAELEVCDWPDSANCTASAED